MLIVRQIKLINYQKPNIFSFTKFGDKAGYKKKLIWEYLYSPLVQSIKYVFSTKKFQQNVYIVISVLPCFLKIILDSVFPSWLPICDWPFCTLPMEQQLNFETLKFQSLKIWNLKLWNLNLWNLNLSKFVLTENCHSTTQVMEETLCRFFLRWVIIFFNYIKIYLHLECFSSRPAGAKSSLMQKR